MRSAALGLMFAVALTTGSLRDVLGVAASLAQGTETLPESSSIFLKNLQDLEVTFDLDVPTSKV